MRNIILLFCFLGMGTISLGQTNTFPSSGNVGIGTTSPGATLDVVGTLRIANTPAPNYGQAVITIPRAKTATGILSSNSALHLATNESDYPFGVKFFIVGASTLTDRYVGMQTSDHNYANDGNLVFQQAGGNVGIGTTSPAEKLSVNGKIRAKEIKVETGWADFVFEQGYNLRSLKDTEQFIAKNGHLPEIPSGKEVEENGVNLGEMNAKLLQKIEELTLYLIEKDEQVTDLQHRVKVLESNK